MGSQTINAKTPAIKKALPVSDGRKPEALNPGSPFPDKIAYCHRTIGNRAVERLMKQGILQAKLKVGQPGDVYEQEANRMAERIMRMTEPVARLDEGPGDRIHPLSRHYTKDTVSRKPGDNEEKFQAQEIPGQDLEITAKTQARIDSLRGGGGPLSDQERAFFEPRFGCDFSGVRVHTGNDAAESARMVNARAYTVGRDVVFGAGEYRPGTGEGRRLLAHELTHVVQQNGLAKNSNLLYEKLQRDTDDSQTSQAEVCSIEEFIEFVKAIENQYPYASPAEVASEIRQLWYSDENWRLMITSRGIPKVDLESGANPITQQYNMRQIAPRGGGLQLETPLGFVDIGHVMAGIDAVLSGFPRWSDIGSGIERGIKYQILRDASGGDPRDFATWAGDLGQAYAEYLYNRYDGEHESESLMANVGKYATNEEILGDIHGYLIVAITRRRPMISNILETMYLKRPICSYETTYKDYFIEVSGVTDLKAFIRERIIRFARIWYSKKVTWGISLAIDYQNYKTAFDETHAKNENEAVDGNKLDHLVNYFLRFLDGYPFP